MLGALFDKMAAFELTVRTALRGHHKYKNSWMPTIVEEFVICQERANVHDRHAVAVYGDGGGVLRRRPRVLARQRTNGDGLLTETAY